MKTKTKQKSLLMISLNIDFGKVKEYHWARFIIFLFAITPYFLSFVFFDKISAFTEINTILVFVFISILLQMPVLIIGVPLYILYIRTKYPEKVSERRFVFQVEKYQSIHYVFSSLWMSGLTGTIVFIVCLIFHLNQSTFILVIYSYLLVRLILLAAIYILKTKNNKLTHYSDNKL